MTKPKNKAKAIKPELLGSRIQTRRRATEILLDGSPACIAACEALGLDVFTSTTPEPIEAEIEATQGPETTQETQEAP